jgi:acetyl esterase/lipase
MKAAALNIQIPIYQMLILPVIDNTATAETAWSNNIHAPWLTPSRMLWYRNMYLPNKSDWENWDVSPQLAPRELLAKSPPTWIAVGEMDILCREAELYGGLLKELEVKTDINVYMGSTHSLLVLDGKLMPMKFLDPFRDYLLIENRVSQLLLLRDAYFSLLNSGFFLSANNW